MYTDLSYRIVLIALATGHLLLSRRYMQRAQAGATLFQKREEGPLLAGAAALCFAGYALGVLVLLINPTWMAWAAMPLPGSLRWCGAPLMALGAALHLWGAHHLGANLTVTISTRAGHTLVTSGPFQWVRHPLYSGGMLESIGVCLLLGSGVVAVFAAGFWGVVVWRTRLEEDALVVAFGEPYRAYRERVGRFVPVWRGRPGHKGD